jgi:hypothetical protein
MFFGSKIFLPEEFINKISWAFQLTVDQHLGIPGDISQEM